MPQHESFLALADQWAHTMLVWIGFGTVVGLAAKAMMPGRDPGGAIATLLMGIGGCVIGCGALSYFTRGTHVSPISPLGFVVATGGAFILLAFYRLFTGRIVYEAGDGPVREREVLPARRPFGRRRRRETVVDE